MNAPIKKTAAKKLVQLLDLTSLNDNDTPHSIAKLCESAITPLGHVAAVCIFPKFIKHAKNILCDTDIKIATVINFPDGNQTLPDCVAEIKNAIESGVDEIDVVMPYEAYKNGDVDDVREFLEACRGIMGFDIVMKVILETGALIYHELIAGASEMVVRAKANFIKTSTGKINPGASPQAVEIILHTIKKLGEPVGCKISGGVRTVEQATEYIDLVEKIMGNAWVSPKTLRFGASSLLQDILAKLNASPR